MIKKEINEIKSLYDTIQDCGIQRLAGCYVNGEKQKAKTFSDTFLNIPEEEMYKYLEIFRKTLSGTPGKNLVDMSFSGNSEAGDKGKILLEKIRKSELKEENLLEEFYDKIIADYNYVGSYLILLIYQAYDVPGVSTDGLLMDDASDEVYSYILCSICPMKLTKPGLGFDDDLREIHTLKQVFAVELPENGFLYPAFNDRSSDDSSLLFFSRKADTLQGGLLDNVLDVSTTLPAKQQKEGFNDFVIDVLGDESSFETVLSIQENLNKTIKEKKTEAAGETVFLDKSSIRNVFEESGVSSEKLEQFDKKFDDQFDMNKIYKKNIDKIVESEEFEGSDPEEIRKNIPKVKVEEKLFADNVAPVRNFEVKTADMLLRINSKHTDIIDTRVIDGKNCLVIEITEDLTVNGIPVRN
ncbi:DUF4317 domain-containing protein [Eubacterium ruminantium]|uniref:DUF4317 domain-containing protein n=1 Tax=Eubacterium ruminantium TaxID=42322 RepID=UPI00156A5AD6|nr:DUF4317 domain-containing protein [Eubacterium ruminantium]